MGVEEFPNLVGSLISGDVGGKERAAVLALATPGASAASSDRRRGGKDIEKKTAVVGKGGDTRKGTADSHPPKDFLAKKTCRVTPPVHDEPPIVEKVAFRPFECSFDGRASGVGNLFKKFQAAGADDSSPLYGSLRSEWYMEYARHTAIAAKFVIRLVDDQAKELAAVKAELEKANAKLAATKGGNDLFKDLAITRKKYEAERVKLKEEKEASAAALGQVKSLTDQIAKMSSDRVEELKRFESFCLDILAKKQRAITRHEDVRVTCNLRLEKVQKFLQDQKEYKKLCYEANQMTGISLFAAEWRKKGLLVSDEPVVATARDLKERLRLLEEYKEIKLTNEDLAPIFSFGFNSPLEPVSPSLTRGLDVAVKRRLDREAREKDAWGKGVR